MEVSEKIRNIRNQSGQSQSDFGQKLGVALKTQQNYEQGKRKPTFEYLQNLHAAGEDVMYIITGEKSVPDGFVRIKRVSATSSMDLGIPADLMHNDVVDSIILQEQWLHLALVHFSSINNLRIVTSHDNSMSDTFEDGDALFIDVGVTEFVNDSVYMVEIYNDIRIKRLQALKKGKIKMISDNKKYESIVIEPDDQFRIIGRIVGKWTFSRF